MKALVLKNVSDLTKTSEPLELESIPKPEPLDDEVLIRVSACAVCHTELDEIEGRTLTRLPLIPVHQVVGKVQRTGSLVSSVRAGDRIGVGWIW
jgi:propanol-preferring alcohol dehydrogenase